MEERACARRADGGGSPIVGRLLDIPAAWQNRPMLQSARGVLSFGAMRESMLRFAGWLSREAGIGRGCRVALCLPKGLEAARAIYGILASGAAYVPLQVQGAPARLAAALASIRPELLIASPATVARIAVAAGPRRMETMRTLRIGSDGQGFDRLLSASPSAYAPASVAPGDLAAVYFTSGSSEEPKGVMLSQGNIAADMDWIGRFHGMDESDRRISQAGLHYISSLDLFYPLVGGSRLFLPDDREMMFPEKIVELLERNRTTIWSSTISELRLLFERGDLGRRDLSSLRRIGFYGEKMPIRLLRSLMDALPQAVFVNMYGTTETSEIAHFPVPRPLPADLACLPLGRPTDIASLSLRDADGNPVGPGELGEICVSGPAVTLGYWGDAALTEAKRVQGQPSTFRTGDLGTMGDDGLLHLVGREDQVIKLRGHRIDLGEVEAVLRSHPRVRDAVALPVASGTGEQAIDAVILAAAPALGAELRLLCLQRLPGFARPRRIIELPEFPFLPSGKVDRRRLRARALE
jgi:amino acid adenylation domain-containing protein